MRDVGDVAFVRWVMEAAGPDARFVVQEKVRGLEACFGCDGREVVLGEGLAEVLERMAVGTGVCKGSAMAVAGVEESVVRNVSENVLAELVERYRPRLFRLYAHIRQLFPGVRSVTVCGELFGGAYSHRSVVRSKGCVPLRTGVYYAPDYEFYALDIRVEEEKNRQQCRDGKGVCYTCDGPFCYDAAGERGGFRGRFLPLTVCNHLFEQLGFFYARTLFQGSLAECLRHPNCFATHLPYWLGLPPLHNNWCAGTVIRPLAPLFTAGGERVLLQNLNSRMGDADSAGKATGIYATEWAATPAAITNVACEPQAPYTTHVSRECADMLAELQALFTPELLSRVLRKSGPSQPRKKSVSMAARLRREVLDEFFQLNLNRYDALPAHERKHITHALQKISNDIGREWGIEKRRKIKVKKNV